MAGRNGGLAMDIVKNSEWPTCGWAPFGFCGPQLSTTFSSPSRTVGFIGFGRIAQATLARLIPFGITFCIYYSNPSSPPKPQLERELLAKYGIKSKRANSLGDLAAESDIVFVLAPGGDKTKHLVDATFLSKMKKTAILVNASRGTLVDSDALAMALKEGKIWAAGLDVVEGEPNVTADHPLVREPRCVVLPHIGSATLETRLSMATLAAKNVIAGVLGSPMPAQLEFQAQAQDRTATKL